MPKLEHQCLDERLELCDNHKVHTTAWLSPPSPPTQNLQAWVGPAGMGKSAGLIQRTKAALNSGLPADRLIVWLAKAEELPRWQAQLAPLPPLCGQAHLASFQSWWSQELRAHWPWLVQAGAPPFPPEDRELVGPMASCLAAEALGQNQSPWKCEGWKELAVALRAFDDWSGAWSQRHGEPPEAMVQAFGHLPTKAWAQALAAWRAWAWRTGHLQGGVGLQAYTDHVWTQASYQAKLKGRAGLVVVDGASSLPPIAWSVLSALAQAGATLLLAEDEASAPAGWMAAGPNWAKDWWAQAQSPPPTEQGVHAWCRAAGEVWRTGQAKAVRASGAVHAVLEDSPNTPPAWIRRLPQLLHEGWAPDEVAVVLPKWRPSLHAHLESSGLPWCARSATEACLSQGPLRALWLLWLGRWVPRHPSLATCIFGPLQELLGESAALAYADAEAQSPQEMKGAVRAHPELQAWWEPEQEKASHTWRRLGQRLWGQKVHQDLQGLQALASWPPGLADALRAFQALLQAMELWENTGSFLEGDAKWAMWAAHQEWKGPKRTAAEAEGRIRIGTPEAIAKSWPRPKCLVLVEASHPNYGLKNSPLAWWWAHATGQSLEEQAALRWQGMAQGVQHLECYPGQQSLDGEATTGPLAAALAMCHANPMQSPAFPEQQLQPLRAPKHMKPREGQQAFLKHRKGHAAVLAVPGSGKSTSLVAYAVALLQEGIVLPWALEIITHTRVAAKHLSLSLEKALQAEGLPPGGVQVGTIHALARQLVRQVPPGMLPLPVGRHRIEETDEKWQQLWQQAWHKHSKQHHQDARWQQAWGQCEQLTRQLETSTIDLIIESAQAVWKACWCQGKQGLARLEAEAPFKLMGPGLAWCFEGLRRQAELHPPEMDLALALLLVEEHPEVAVRWRGALRVVLEDEAQDTGPLALALLRALTNEQTWWVRIGDPNQSIYGFTGAKPAALIQHGQQHPAYPLSEASRSSPFIAGLANDWVRGHQKAKAPLFPNYIQSTSDAPVDEAIPMRFLENPRRQTNAIIEDVLQRWPRKAAHECWAIVAPYNFLVADLALACMRHGIPVLTDKCDVGGLEEHQTQAEWWHSWWLGQGLGPHALHWESPWMQMIRQNPTEAKALAALDFWAHWWRQQSPSRWALVGEDLRRFMQQPQALAKAVAKQEQSSLPQSPQSLSILNVHGVKGLEFDRVWLPKWLFYTEKPKRHNPLKAWALASWSSGQSVQPQLASQQAIEAEGHERIRQAYVCLTRAQRELIFCDLASPQADPISAAWRGVRLEP